MVLKTNTRNSLVDDVYDVLISVSCAAAFKLVLPGLVVYGGCLGGTARGPLKTSYEICAGIQKELCISWMCEMYFNTFMLHVMKITQTD